MQDLQHTVQRVHESLQTINAPADTATLNLDIDLSIACEHCVASSVETMTHIVFREGFGLKLPGHDIESLAGFLVHGGHASEFCRC